MNKNLYRGKLFIKLSYTLMHEQSLYIKSIFSEQSLHIKSIFSGIEILTLSKKSYSMYENDRALDDLVTREIEPFSWRDSDVYKTTLNIYSDFSTRRKHYNVKSGSRR